MYFRGSRMRQMPADKYNIAWFKLAEFVSRGEKERALGLYRLLVHSFEDKIFALQLEGDILMAFNDETAIAKYESAAHHYVKHKRYPEALAVFEHLVYLKPEDQIYLKKLIDMYLDMHNTDKALHHLYCLCTLLIIDSAALLETLKDYQKKLIESSKVLLYKKIISLLVNSAFKVESNLLEFMVQDLIKYDNREVEQEFLKHIQKMDETLYHRINKQLNHKPNFAS